MTGALRLSGVSARRGSALALDMVTLDIAAGESVAVIGANGAGKSTLLQAIMGLVPAEGEISVHGRPVSALPTYARARAGLAYSPEGRRVFPDLTVRETLLLACRQRSTDLRDIFRLFPALEQRRDTQAGQLSGGEQQMLAIGRALVTEPRVLLLDEPSLGLSPLVADQVLARVRDIAATGAAVLLAEQSVGRALAVADRLYMLRLGRIVGQGTPAELQERGDLQAIMMGG
jgi:branched-chain amino acid transport system ATP-binding protein